MAENLTFGATLILLSLLQATVEREREYYSVLCVFVFAEKLIIEFLFAEEKLFIELCPKKRVQHLGLVSIFQLQALSIGLIFSMV